jgi:hypothetical protein
MQCRTVLAHIWAMHTLPYHTRCHTAVQWIQYCTNNIIFTLHMTAGNAHMDIASCHYRMAQHFTFTVTQFPFRLQAIGWSMLLGFARLQFSTGKERIMLRLARGHSLPFSFTCAVSVTHSRTDRQTYGSGNIGPAVSRGSAATERTC